MNLFKKTKVTDERIINLKNKIYAEIFILVTVICFISIVLKYFVYNVGIVGIATELTLLIISGIYYLSRSIKLGVVSAEVDMHDSQSKWSQRKKNLYSSIVLGVVIALALGINSAVQYAEGVSQSIYYFFLTGFVSLMIYLPIFLITFVIGNDAIKKKSDNEVNKMFSADQVGENDEKH